MYARVRMPTDMRLLYKYIETATQLTEVNVTRRD